MIGQRRPAINVVGCKPRAGAEFELIRRRCAVGVGSGPAAIAKADRAARADLGGFGVRQTAGHRRKPQTNERSNRGAAYAPNRCNASLSHCQLSSKSYRDADQRTTNGHHRKTRRPGPKPAMKSEHVTTAEKHHDGDGVGDAQR